MANTGTATDFRKVDLNNLIVPPLVKKDKGNLSTIPLYNNGDGTNTMLCVQTPPCRFPFGLSKQTNDSGVVSWSLNGSFDRYREDPLMKDFYSFFTNLQDYTIALAAHNSKAWFGEKQEAIVCRALMNKAIKTSKDDEKAAKYDPTFKVTVRTKKDGEFWASCKGVNGETLNLTDITPGCKGVMKIKLSSIYVINGKFGFTFDLEWVRITELSSLGRTDDFNPDMYNTAPAAALSGDAGTDSYGGGGGIASTAATIIGNIPIPSLSDAIGGGKRERQDDDTSSSTASTLAKGAPIKRAKPIPPA